MSATAPQLSTARHDASPANDDHDDLGEPGPVGRFAAHAGHRSVLSQASLGPTTTRAYPIASVVAAGVIAGGRALMDLHRERKATAPAATAVPAAASEVMNVDEAAAFLGLDRNTIYDAAGRNAIPHRRIGKRILLSRTQLVAWLGACKVASGGNG